MRNPMDDPVFDPWHLDGDTAPAPSARPRRWRSTGESLGRAAATRSVPRPGLADAPDAPEGDLPGSERPVWFVDAPTGERHAPDGAEVPAPGVGGGGRPVAADAGPAGVDASHAPDEPADVREHVLARIRLFLGRLCEAGHGADVHDEHAPDADGLRVTVRRRPGPFDPHPPEDAVLSLSLLDGGEDLVVASLSVGPAGEPAETREARISDLTDAWLDDLLLRLVERALQEA